MKTFNKKKGFTIVELVIVVAVIGVLTAILVPTFVNLTNKANKAADESLVKNLNTQLRMKETTEGKNLTLTDALSDAKEAGYLVENLTPRGDQDILWNQEADEFVFGDKATGELYKYWKIYEKAADVPATQTYSIYAKGKSWKGDFTYTVGFDVGENEGVSSVKYVKGETAKKDVRIRTLNGSLEVDADTDVVSHWSFIDKVDIKAIAGESYHEYGTVRVGLQVAQGHVVVEPKGSVNELAIPETATNVSVKVEDKAEVKTAVIDSTEATVAVEAGAKVEQVVGETEKITGAGAAEAKEGAIKKTLVYNESADGKPTLKEALQAGASYIVFAEDLSLGKWSSADNVAVPLTYDIVIDGNGHTLSTTASRGIWVDENDVTVSVKNLKLVGGPQTERGVQVNGSKTGVDLALDNIELTGISYYAVNICNYAEVDLRITNSKITGWGAINLWSNKYAVYIANSELNGINDKGYNAEGWNDFGTVVLEGDTTGRTTEHSSEIDVKIVNSRIGGSQSTGNKQYLILFNNPSASNVVRLENCTLDYTDGDSESLVEGNTNGNKLYVDGNLAD